MPIPMLYAVMMEGDGDSGTGGADPFADDVPQGRGELLDTINRYRARHGKPPIPPREDG